MTGFIVCGCSDTADIENKPYDHIGGYNTMNNAESEKYYAELRAYKQQAVNYGRPVAFGWYSNWSPAGTYRRGYLTSMPDSMDIVSMWSGAPNRFTITPEQKADKEFVQKVKGTKLLEVTLLSYIGKGRTPDSVYTKVEKQAEEEGWATDKARVEAKTVTEENLKETVTYNPLGKSGASMASLVPIITRRLWLVLQRHCATLSLPMTGMDMTLTGRLAVVCSIWTVR